MKKVSQLIYGIKGLSIDTLIDTYIERLSHIEVVDDTHINENGTWEPEIKIIEPKHKPSRNVLYPKFQFLIHLIITRCMRSKDNIIHLHEEHYRKVLGRQLGEMLYTLEETGVISIGYYKVGEESRPISLNLWNIEQYITYSKDILKFHERATQLTFIDGIKKKEIVFDKFIENYNSSLLLLDLLDKENAIDYIKKNINQNTHKYYYCLYVINNFIKREKTISSIDMNNRIYHYLTNMPKVLKQFYNIKYQLDIHNSHPLLFNSFLIREYNISSNLINNIINIYKNTTSLPPSHYDVQYFHKMLVDNNLQNNANNKVPEDVLYYIFLTSKGVLWDAFANDEISRDDAKHNLLGRVYYSEDIFYKDPLVKRFSSLFPSVYKLIISMKEEKNKLNLACRMMRIESALMRKILTRFYEQGYKVVSIHDAVIVLDVDENKTFRCDDAVKLMEEVYAEYGLFPSVDVMTFEKGA